jgi:hypothetical protein
MSYEAPRLESVPRTPAGQLYRYWIPLPRAAASS